MKALIVDDEPLARLELRRLLKPHGWIEVAGEAGNIDEAYERIEALAPDIVFLDVQMPGGSGFDLLERLERLPRVIFTTAYDHYAIKAFDVNALDYLLKPVEPERLAAAVARLRGWSPRPRAREDRLEQLFVRDGPRCWFMPLAEVRLLEAEGNYVRLYWGTERPLLGRPLTALAEKLDPQRFFRASRQHVINLGFVDGVERAPDGALFVQLRPGHRVRISRRQARLFRSQLGPDPDCASPTKSSHNFSTAYNFVPQMYTIPLAMGTNGEYRTKQELSTAYQGVEKWSRHCITCCHSPRLRALFSSFVTWCRWPESSIAP
jgi:two-component system LytT family response regulator